MTEPRPSAFRLARFDPAVRESVNKWLASQGLPPIQPYSADDEPQQDEHK